MRADGPVTGQPEARAAGPADPYRLVLRNDHVVLAGSVDTFTADRLAAVLAGTPTGARVVLELGSLEFIDVAGCRALAGWAAALRAREVPVEIRGASTLVQRMWHVLELDDVAAVTFRHGG